MHSIYITDDNNCEGAVVWGGGGKWMEEVDSGVVVSLTGVVTSDASCFNTNDGRHGFNGPEQIHCLITLGKLIQWEQ